MTDANALRRKLVDELRESGFLRSDRVAEAFAAVPRHLFVPGAPLDETYRDRPIVTRRADGVPTSSSSQPAIMATMLEQLDVQPGDRVLEIGAGTGYNAALLAFLAGEGGGVTTIDIDPETVETARAHLNAAGYERVHVVSGDGGFGYADDAPYDRTIVTAGCWQIPPPWIEQLVEDGLVVLPLRINGAQAVFALRNDEAMLRSVGAAGGGFMPLQGDFGQHHEVAEIPDYRFSSDAEIDPLVRESLPRLLAGGRPAPFDPPEDAGARGSLLMYIGLQGVPVVSAIHTVDGIHSYSLIVTSSESAVRWHLTAESSELTVTGTDEAFDFFRASVGSWCAAGEPDVHALQLRVTATEESLPAIPMPGGKGYRFRRGEHLYELWFEQ